MEIKILPNDKGVRIILLLSVIQPSDFEINSTVIYRSPCSQTDLRCIRPWCLESHDLRLIVAFKPWGTLIFVTIVPDTSSRCCYLIHLSDTYRQYNCPQDSTNWVHPLLLTSILGMGGNNRNFTFYRSHTKRSCSVFHNYPHHRYNHPIKREATHILYFCFNYLRTAFIRFAVDRKGLTGVCVKPASFKYSGWTETRHPENENI